MGLTPQYAPDHGLLFPRDIQAWKKWEHDQHRVRNLKHAVTGSLRPRSPQIDDNVLLTKGNAPKTLVVIDAPTSSQQAALIAPANHMDSCVVMCPRSVTPFLSGQWEEETLTPAHLSALPQSISTILASGHYLPLGTLAYRFAIHRDLRFCVVQHGLLTPFMAPLPRGAHAFVFSDNDAEFWLSGRTDVTTQTVSSELLWQAAQTPVVTIDESVQPMFLGQLHGTELGRYYMTRTSYSFCSMNQAIYRPHPSEKDKVSRAIHAVWQRQGISIDYSSRPLTESGHPVVSVFSTGVVEMACRGIPSWVYAPGAPSWVHSFHSRYNMAQWGESPTAPPSLPTQSPAARIAFLCNSLN
ncbi:hypothetical protein [Actinomyces vulturis]|uniref:hypothetical protein n=1 Tax=Actinomyces vulturis TaxID=1857645 RepID=UPI00082D15C3|nr:hypothetical protein [Actinomyces vulturis]